MKRSITRTLQLSLSAVLILALVIAGYVSFHAASGQIERDYDSQLISDSYLVWTLVNEELQEENDLHEVRDLLEMRVITAAKQREMLEFNQYRAFRVWRGGELVLASNTAQPADTPPAAEGFSTNSIGGASWRVYTMIVPNRHISVEIWEHRRIRERLMDRILDSITASAIVLIPLIWILLLIVIRYGLSGLTQLAQQVESRDPDSLEFIRLKPELPRELYPLKSAINGLIAKLRANLERERLLMDSVAHEIRTPLTTLKLKGELAAAAPNAEAQQAAVKSLLYTLNDTVALANRLLLFSKARYQEIELTPVSPFVVAQAVLAELALLAMEKQLEVSLNGDETTVMQSHTEWLRQLLTILIENAIKYTPARGKIAVTVAANMIRISDSGPGIPLPEREAVFKKFYRAPGATKAGHGLGLAIAQELAQRLHLAIDLEETPGGGLSVTLRTTS